MGLILVSNILSHLILDLNGVFPPIPMYVFGFVGLICCILLFNFKSSNFDSTFTHTDHKERLNLASYYLDEVTSVYQLLIYDRGGCSSPVPWLTSSALTDRKGSLAMCGHMVNTSSDSVAF